MATKVFCKSIEPLRNESLQTISKRLCECWLLIEQKKNPLYYFAQSANINFSVTFVCSYTAIIVSAIFYFNLHEIAEKSRKSFPMSERKIFPPVIFVWTDQRYRNYKLCLVYLYSGLGAVRHTRLARTACISLQHGNIPFGRNIRK